MKTQFIKTKHNFFFSLIAFVFFTSSFNAQVVQWAKKTGGVNNDNANSIVSDAVGNVFTVGTFSGVATFGSFTLTSSSSTDIFVTKIDVTSGNTLWAKKFGGLGEDFAYAVTSSTTGFIYITGRFSGTILFGSTSLIANGTYDAFVVKLDAATGAVIWAQKMGGSGSDSGLAITSDAQGNIYATGYYQGNAIFGTFSITPLGTNLNVFVVKLDAISGNVLWAKSQGGAGYNFGNAIIVDDLGGIYTTGSFESTAVFGSFTLTAEGNSDAFISKMDATSGNTLWAKKWGGSGNESASSLVINNDGYIYTIGKFELSAAFGTNTLSASGSSDMFITKTDPNVGTTLLASKIGGSGYELGNSICKDSNSNLYVTGQFSGIVAFGTNTLISAGNADVFVLRMNDTLSVSWASRMGGTSADSGNSIAMDSNGNLFVIGSFQLSSSFDTYTLSSSGNADVFTLMINPLFIAINEQKILETDRFTITPNPFKDELRIATGQSDNKVFDLSIYDVSGKTVLQTKQFTSQSISLSELNPGIYFVSISSTDGKRSVTKVIKE